MNQWVVVFIFLLIAQPALALQITEVMYNPQGDDDQREFVELFDDTAQNLSGFIIADSTSNDTLVLLRSGVSGYAVIVEDGADLAAMNVSQDAAVYTIGATIGNGLGNTQDAVSLYDHSGARLDSMSYDGTLANGNGHSLALLEGQWGESSEIGGSAGRANSIPQSPPPNATDNSTEQNTTAPPCGGAFNLSTDKSLYHAGEKVLVQFTVGDEDAPFVITYWVEDLHGSIIRSPRNTTNANTKTFTARADDADQVLLVKARYQPICDALPVEQSTQIIVVGDGIAPQNSSLSFQNPPSAATFGETLSLDLEAYRASTRKSTVEIYLATHDGTKLSKTAKVTAEEQFTPFIAHVELSLYTNCNGKYPSGQHQLIAKGLDALTVVPITLRNADCVAGGTTAERQTDELADTEGAHEGGGSALRLSFTDFQPEAEAGSTYTAVLALANPASVERTVDVWSYAYRGSRSLSGDREANRQTFALSAGETQEIPLEVVLDDAEPGDASYKVKVLEEGRKTPVELKGNLSILPAAQHRSQAIALAAAPAAANASAPALSAITGSAVYFSKTAVIRRIALYALLGACFIVISLLVWRGK